MAAVDAVLCSRGAAVTPHNTNNLSEDAACLYIGGAGDVKIDTPEGSTLTFVAVPAGSILPWRARRVYATGTSATNIVAGYLS